MSQKIEYGKIYNSTRTEWDGSEWLYHRKTVKDATSESGRREYAYWHRVEEKCLVCCDGSDNETL